MIEVLQQPRMLTMGVMKVFLCRDRMAIVSTAQQKPNFPWSWI